MVKRKRGGFSFFDVKKPQPQPVKRKRLNNGILIVNTLSVDLLEAKKKDILSIVKRIIDENFLSGTIYERLGSIESLYILLNMEVSTVEVIKNIKNYFGYAKKYIIVENKHLDIKGKQVEPIEPLVNKDSIPYEHDKELSLPIEEERIDSKPKLHVELMLKDTEDLFDFLKSRPINHQTRERYREPLTKKESAPKTNESNRSTFVAKNLDFDKDEVEVYVNGYLSPEICCRVEEKSDAYILHLFYKGARQYSKLITIIKDEAKEPLLRINYNDEDNSISVNGKNLTLTFEGYDAYRRQKYGKTSNKKEVNVSTRYEGKPTRQRKTAIIQQTNVDTDNDTIHVRVNEIVDDNNILENDKTCDQEKGEIPALQKELQFVMQETEERNKRTEKGKIRNKRKMGFLARLMLRFWKWYYGYKK